MRPGCQNVGGIPEIVADRETGIVLLLSAGPLDYPKSIRKPSRTGNNTWLCVALGTPHIKQIPDGIRSAKR